MTTATQAPLTTLAPQPPAPPQAAPPPAEPAAPEFTWEHFGNQGDWVTFLVWLGCFLLLAMMLAYDTILSLFPFPGSTP